MGLLSIELWVAFQMFIDLVLVVLILYLLSNLRLGMQRDVSKEAYEDVVAMIEPLLKEAGNAAKDFEAQLQEKKKIINDLNEKLDRRILSINLLLGRAKNSFEKSVKLLPDLEMNVYDKHENILKLHKSGENTETIAKKLSLPKGEVDLVVNLKSATPGLDHF